jgi:peptidoglycan LD-endopeptidase CwlK
VYDEDTQLSYLNARYYTGARGQFISQDPEFWATSEEWLFDPQSQNAYSYARNNPINLTDPTGRSAVGNLINSIKSAWNNLWNGNTTSYQAPAPAVVSQKPKVEAPRTTTWDSVSDARIKQLDPRVQQPATNFINNTESELNTQLRVTQGYRSIADQDKLYNQSRSNPPTGPWATNAKGGQSYHNYGMAIDVVIMENGKPNWNKSINQDIANIGAKQGFEWGGNWAPPSTDYPHFQMTFGQSWRSLLKASKQ